MINLSKYGQLLADNVVLKKGDITNSKNNKHPAWVECYSTVGFKVSDFPLMEFRRPLKSRKVSRKGNVSKIHSVKRVTKRRGVSPPCQIMTTN